MIFILFELLLDNMSTFVCVRGGGEADTGGAWECEQLAGVSWPALVSLAPHTLVISVSAAPESHEYVR